MAQDQPAGSVPAEPSAEPQPGVPVEAEEAGEAGEPVLELDDPALDQRPDESVMEHRKRMRRAAAARMRRDLDRLAALPKHRPNPLMMLPDERRSQIFCWLRECPFPEAVRQMLAEEGLPDVRKEEIDQFFETEARQHWEVRLERAATEADALVQLVEESPVKFSSGILAALGQEAFRQIASGNVAPESMTRITNLFLKARGDERAEQLMDLRREDARRKWLDQTQAALEAFAAEIENHPEARAAFEELKAELMRGVEER